MNALIRDYLRVFTERFGRGWNYFWFLPSSATTLSAIRPLVGLVALWWHSTYTADLLLFFGTKGVVTPTLLQRWPGDPPTSLGPIGLSYFNLAGSDGVILALHWVGFAVLALFTLGVFTRLTSVLSVFVVLSYIHRGPMLTSEAEPVLAMILIYLALGEVFSLFERPKTIWFDWVAGGACGAMYSFDAWLRPRIAEDTQLARGAEAGAAQTPITSVTLSTRLIQVHLALIYAMSGLAMASNDAWWGGEAVWWLLARPEEYAFALTPWMDSHPYVINLWTYAILLFQLAFPVLVWTRLWRPLLVALAIPVWALTALASGLYLYSAIMLLGTLTFVAPEVPQLLFARQARHGDAIASLS
jgi:hypothetical protein